MSINRKKIFQSICHKYERKTLNHSIFLTKILPKNEEQIAMFCYNKNNSNILSQITKKGANNTEKDNKK